MSFSSHRRAFLKNSAIAGVGSVFAHAIPVPRARAFPGPESTLAPDVVSVTGKNHYDATLKAVETLGGMRRFITSGSVVGLLVNSRFRNPGTYVKPEITLAVLALCHEAGAKKVISLEDMPGHYWESAAMTDALKEYADSLRDPSDYVMREISGGVRLKEAAFRRDLFDCDIFINVGIAKDHEGTRFTGQLKNIMGATSGPSNRYFHSGSHARGYYDDVEFLSGCIADANRPRKPALSINDVTDVILTNGPFGPGRLARHETVVAGTDPVAVDAYSATLLGLNPAEIGMLTLASAYGIGTHEREKIKLMELQL